jgi:hypothetical protein
MRPVARQTAEGGPNVRLPYPKAGVRAQGRLRQLSARSGLKHQCAVPRFIGGALAMLGRFSGVPAGYGCPNYDKPFNFAERPESGYQKFGLERRGLLRALATGFPGLERPTTPRHLPTCGDGLSPDYALLAAERADGVL